MDQGLLLNTASGLLTAFLLGGIIGFERQWRQRTAGLRTNVLVAVGAAAFADLGMRLGASDGAVRVVSYIVSGIGFLGAGVIMKEGAQVRGINTAATLWASGAVGAFAGSGEYGEAALVAVFVLAGNTLLRPVANYINRRPISYSGTEATYRIHVRCKPELVPEVRDLIYEELEQRHYPIREIEDEADADEFVEVVTTLVPTTANPDDLDAVTRHLEKHGGIDSARWTITTDV